MRIFLILSLFISINAHALTTVSVITDGGGDYATLCAAFTGVDAVSDDVVINASGSTLDTTQCTAAPASPTSVTIVGDGTYTHYNTSYLAMTNGRDNMTWRNIKFRRGGTGVSVRGFFSSGKDNLIVEGCEFWHDSITKDLHDELVVLVPKSGGSLIFRNNYVHDSDYTGLRIYTENGEDIYVHNNTLKDNATYGLNITVGNVQAANVSIINNLSVGSGTADYALTITPSGTYTKTTNASSDTSSPNDALDSVTVTFDTAPALDVTDTDVIDQGTTIGSFSDDIFGVSRPQGAAWDIGAAEYSGGGGGPSSIILRRRRI